MEWSITKSTGDKGEIWSGSPPILATAVRIAAKSTTATGSQKLKVDDFIIETHKQDELKLVGGTNLMGDKSGGSQGSSEPITTNVNVTFEVKAGNLPIEEIKRMKEDALGMLLLEKLATY